MNSIINVFLIMQSDFYPHIKVELGEIRCMFHLSHTNFFIDIECKTILTSRPPAHEWSSSLTIEVTVLCVPLVVNTVMALLYHTPIHIWILWFTRHPVLECQLKYNYLISVNDLILTLKAPFTLLRKRNLRAVNYLNFLCISFNNCWPMIVFS